MKYIDAEKLKAEIEKRRLHFNKEAEKYQALNNGYSQNCYGARDALRYLENFLDTLSEEPDKSLEEAAEEHLDIVFGKGKHHPFYKELFIAGGQWKEEQMMEDAVEGEIVDSGFDDGTAILKAIVPDRRYDSGDKVKVIVIKED